MLDHRRRSVLLASLAVAALFLIPWGGPLARWTDDLDARFLSFAMRHQPPQPPPSEVVGVTMDGASLDALGRYPWKRSVHARLIDRLTAMGATVIALDTFFVRPTDPAEDAALAAASENGQLGHDALHFGPSDMIYLSGCERFEFL